jgi:CopA family copper-resistance protein
MNRRGQLRGVAFLITIAILSAVRVQAAVVEYDLTIAEHEVNFTGKTASAMTINGGIPGPTLRFTEGDRAIIHVHNKMAVETSIHWHGVLVPPDMDGVPYVSFPPIAPGTTFTYKFPIRQSGTYWYHSHTSLQEQSGVYGSIVIEPKEERFRPDHDYVVLLSDWTDEDPHEVLRTLKRGSEWYSIEKRSGQSLLGAASMGMLGDYFKRWLMRMPPMDLSDVAYDRFLLNGLHEQSLLAKPGETIRLRIIDGSATTYFHLEFAAGPVEIISADGLPVEPVKAKRFLIGVAETYDVLLTVPEGGSHEFRATSHDGSGHASLWIGSGERHPAPVLPRPNLYHAMGGLSLGRIFSLTPAGAMGMPDRDVRAGKFDLPGMAGMDSMEMEHGMETKGGMVMDGHEMGDGKMNMNEDAMPNMEYRSDKEPRCLGGLLAEDVACSPLLAMEGGPERPGTPYEKLRSTRPTAFAGEKPIREIRLTLDGDMERYVWFLNNKALSETDVIPIRGGEVVRFIMINRTMMHHPMHLHGHFFRVINRQGEYSPLKHTVDVAPMSTTVIEFDANEWGDWFFHCHLLYHMKSGMARVVHYEGFRPHPSVTAVRPKLYKESWYPWMAADVLSNMSEGYATFASTRWALTVDWEVGWQEVEETEHEVNLTATYFRDRFLNLYAGGTFSNETGDGGIFGLRYLLPLNLAADFRVDTEGDFRAVMVKEFMLTPRAGLSGEAQYDAESLWEGSVGLTYVLNRNFALSARWHSDFRWGGGLRLWF